MKAPAAIPTLVVTSPFGTVNIHQSRMDAIGRGARIGKGIGGFVVVS